MKSVSAWSAVFLMIGILSGSCSSKPTRSALRDSLLLSTENLKGYYNLSEPQAKYFLPYYLAEVSGLTFKNPGSLLAVQDELGVLYEFDLSTSKVVKSIKFDSRHDFEGVEIVGDSVFVLESDGDIRIFAFHDALQNNIKTLNLETGLDTKNDTEGLGYDPNSHGLLIACKSSGELNKNHLEGKAVYRFDLNTLKLDLQPFFNITRNDLEKYFEKNKNHDYNADRFRFEPSAIAFNPVDKFYYLLASVGKLIVVFDGNKVIRATYSIPASVLIQPEGLCFSSGGDMFISSEGDGDKGYIIKYSMKRK